MTKYLIITPIGICTTDYNNPETVEWVKFEGSESEIAEKYYSIIENTELESYKEFISKMMSITTDQKFLFDELFEKEWISNLEITDEKSTFNVRNKIYSFLSDEEKKKIDEVSKIYASFVVQRHSEARDVFIGQAIHAVDDLTKTINLFANRASEWYGPHFPELIQNTTDIGQLFKFIEKIGLRQNFNEKSLSDLTERKRNRIIELSQNSLGVELEEEDLAPMQTLSRQGLDLIKTRADLERYIEISAGNIMPNTCALVGPLIASRLLAYAGSLFQLAKLPASTVQLLGAEKALFRHLKSGERPPKHGIIFQAAAIHSAPYHQRGKIARALAGKLSIASRIDYFTGEDKTAMLEMDLKKRLEDIAKKYPRAPVRSKKERKPAYKDKDKRQRRDGRKGDRRKRDEKGRNKDYRQKKRTRSKKPFRNEK